MEDQQNQTADMLGMSGSSRCYDDEIDIDELTSIGDPNNLNLSVSTRSSAINVFSCKNLSEAVGMIIAQAVSDNSDQMLLSGKQERVFEIIESISDDPAKMFQHLIKHFTELYHIDLYIIAYHRGKYVQVNAKHHTEANTKRQMGYILFNKQNRIEGVLGILNNNEHQQTVFLSSDMYIQFAVYMYLSQINDTSPPPSCFETNPFDDKPGVQRLPESLQKEANNTDLNSSSDNPSRLRAKSITPNEDLETYAPVLENDEKEKYHKLIGQLFGYLRQLLDRVPGNLAITEISSFLQSNTIPVEYLSEEQTIMALHEAAACLISVGFVQQLPLKENQGLSSTSDIQVTNQVDQSLPPFIESPDINQTMVTTNASNPIDDLTTEQVPMSQEPYDPPTLEKHLMSTWHPRTIKEYAKRPSSRLKCVGSKQRDEIMVKVPPADDRILYLSAAVFDVNYRLHSTKICLLNKTKIEKGKQMVLNDLKCLNFNDCDPNDTVDIDKKEIHMKISPSERHGSHKGIIIHMINLYQRSPSSIDVDRPSQLKKFIIGFWFSIRQGSVYQRVSQVNYSAIIEERRESNSGRKREVKRKKLS